MFMLPFGLQISGGVLGGANVERKGEANSFFRILCFYWFKVIMKQSDDTSFVTISLVEAPRVRAIGEHFMMINTSLDKVSSPTTTPTYFLKKGVLCLILTCLNFLVFSEFNSSSKPSLFCWDCCFLAVLSCDTVCWTKNYGFGYSVLLFPCNCISVSLHRRELDCSPMFPVKVCKKLGI